MADPRVQTGHLPQPHYEVIYCKCSRNCGCIIAVACKMAPETCQKVWFREEYVRKQDRGGDEATARMFANVGGHSVKVHGLDWKE